MCLLSVVKAGAKSLSGCKFIMVWYFTRMFGSFNLIRRITNLAKKEFAANILATGVGRWNCCSRSHIKRRLNSNSNMSEQATTSSTETIWFKQSIYANGFKCRMGRVSLIYGQPYGRLLYGRSPDCFFFPFLEFFLSFSDFRKKILREILERENFLTRKS